MPSPKASQKDKGRTSDYVLSDSDSDTDSQQGHTRKVSKSGRLKKFIAARAVSSKTGRNKIQTYLGEEGSELINLICGAVDAYKKIHPEYEVDGEKLRKYVFKLVVKIGVLYDDKVIQDKDFEPIATPLRTFSWKFTTVCEMPMMFFGQDTNLVIYLDELETGIVKILKPHVTGNSLERLQYIRQAFTDDVMQAIFKDPELDSHRRDIARMASAMLTRMRIPRPIFS